MKIDYNFSTLFFVKKLIQFLLVLLVLSIAADFIVSNRIKKSNSYANGEIQIWKDILSGNVNDNLLIYGSSRAMVHFNSKLIQEHLKTSTYNMGIDGHNFWLQYLRHKKILKHNKIPKYIILSVGDFTLAKREDLYNSEQFLPFLCDFDIYKYTSDYKGYSKLDYVIPMLRYRGKLEVIYDFIIKEKKDVPYRIKGFRGMKRSWNNDLENARKDMESIHIQLHPESIALMKQFLRECQDLGIKTIMVYPPEFIKGQQFVSNREEIINIYNDIAKSFEIQFIDYSNDTMSYNKDLFYNSMHLNEKGANAFTLNLIEKIKEIEFFNQ
ncbi:hypothetical protein [Seonamhaeicola aphaedonensis]|uniref:GDSL-like lipase/acylhydrolase family protein n=1 Tax=Seonamhaeicola aphaedonensis TaxID=1461338 RepID=A0A3D9HG16_9FLAO|nr:hypothetical protein [Seonamhaeicola aphaedonensis]RED48375.1 hypothetical protein DFQ02_104221 [Seonamhaeicola aphaedonensis]